MWAELVSLTLALARILDDRILWKSIDFMDFNFSYGCALSAGCSAIEFQHFWLKSESFRFNSRFSTEPAHFPIQMPMEFHQNLLASAHTHTPSRNSLRCNVNLVIQHERRKKFLWKCTLLINLVWALSKRKLGLFCSCANAGISFLRKFPIVAQHWESCIP